MSGDQANEAHVSNERTKNEAKVRHANKDQLVSLGHGDTDSGEANPGSNFVVQKDLKKRALGIVNVAAQMDERRVKVHRVNKRLLSMLAKSLPMQGSKRRQVSNEQNVLAKRQKLHTSVRETHRVRRKQQSKPSGLHSNPEQKDTRNNAEN